MANVFLLNWRLSAHNIFKGTCLNLTYQFEQVKQNMKFYLLDQAYRESILIMEHISQQTNSVLHII
jgi:hypothetical protein